MPPSTRQLRDDAPRTEADQLAFVTPADPPRLPSWLTGAERGAVTGIAAITIGPAPMYALYLWRNWSLLPLDIWQVLLAQAVTYAVLSGALWGACVGAALTPRPPRLGRGVSALVRVQLGALAGALGCIPAGVVAAAHFGQMPTPYFGGPEILAGTVGSILVAGVRFARAEHALGLGRAIVQTLAPLPIIALLLLPCALLPGATLSLELDALRPLADQLGLATLGALVGATLGGIAGCWMALIALLLPKAPPLRGD